MNSYLEYLAENRNTLPLEEADEIFRALAAGVDPQDEDLAELYADFLERAREYADIRGRWLLMDRAGREAADAGRTAMHDRFIMAVRVLARMQEKMGKDVSWLERLEGPEELRRKRIGDFACWVMLFYGLNAR